MIKRGRGHEPLEVTAEEFIEAVNQRRLNPPRGLLTRWVSDQGGCREAAVRTLNIASICKDAGLLLVTTDFQEADITPKGLAFIGKA